MKELIISLSLISLLSFSFALPHFTFSGIESFHDCSLEKGKIYLYIIGSLSEEVSSATIANIKIKRMGEFQCALAKNEGEKNPSRSHVITCTIEGNFAPTAHLLKEPKVNGFDFLNENGESTWPTDPEKATFLIGECGEKVELDKEALFDSSGRNGLSTGTHYEAPLKTIRKDEVDKALNSLPERSKTHYNKMIPQMKSTKEQFSLSDMEAAYMVYKWICQNIKIDCYNFENKNWKKMYLSGIGTYSSGVGYYEGFSELFKDMCKGMGIVANTIAGYTKGPDFKYGEIPDETDHIWNYIIINENYYLVDVTWGMGSCDGEKYIPNFRESYFCPRPEALISTHFPVDKRYQLVYPKITLEQFVNNLKINMTFFEYGGTEVSPNSAIIDTYGKFEVKIKYDSDVDYVFSYRFYTSYYKIIEEKNTCWMTKQEKSALLTCYTNNRGIYTLEVYGGPSNTENYPLLFKYEVQSAKPAADKPINFPTVYDQYYKYNMELIEPLDNPLIRGNLVDFKVRTTALDNLYVLNGGIERELENDGNGLFTGESIYILGEEVVITTKKGDKSINIVKYTTELVKPTYPEIFNGHKNVLYSPLMDTLKREKTYNFKIKCKECKQLAVIDGYNDPIYLTENNGLYTGTVRIEGPSKVDIVDIINEYTETYITYYRYKTSY